jgi:hypothetical protein
MRVTLPVQVEHPAVLHISASLQSVGCALPQIAYDDWPCGIRLPYQDRELKLWVLLQEEVCGHPAGEVCAPKSGVLHRWTDQL